MITKKPKEANVATNKADKGVHSISRQKEKKNAKNVNKEKSKGGGLDAIESLFSEKKRQDVELKKMEQQNMEKARQERKQRQEEIDKLEKEHMIRSNESGNEKWWDDGLGGKYNKEGYTGRVVDGVKVFKTHLLQSDKSGTTKDCPFDCSCCYI